MLICVRQPVVRMCMRPGEWGQKYMCFSLEHVRGWDHGEADIPDTGRASPHSVRETVSTLCRRLEVAVQRFPRPT